LTNDEQLYICVFFSSGNRVPFLASESGSLQI
jgi:hypothetical protein